MSKNDGHAPLLIMRNWMDKEKELGSASPNRVVLATSSPEGIPHSRIVAIREITPDGVLFFTQQGTRKVTELTQNPHASMTLWLALQQRQVILEGIVKPLTPSENEKYWATIPREQQLRFFAYAPTSGQAIPSISVLDNQLDALAHKFLGDAIPMSTYYCGFHLTAESMYFYTLNSDTFSEVLKYQKQQDDWVKQLLSP